MRWARPFGRDESVARMKADPCGIAGPGDPGSGEWWQYMKELAFQHPVSILLGLPRDRPVDRDSEALYTPGIRRW